MHVEEIYRSAEGEQAVMAFYDRMLTRWPVPHEELHIGTRYGDTFVLASGNRTAPPVMLLHGSASNALAWMADVGELSGRFRVYAVDLPGEPGRSAHTRPPWQGPAFADWLSDVLDGLGALQAALVGLSQGGWTALKFATACPERVAALILLAPGGVVPTRLSFLLRAIPLSMLGRRGADALNRVVFGSQPIHPDALAFMNLIMTHFKARVGAEILFSDDELRRLTMPVLLIGGGRDAIRPSEKIAARLQALVPRLETILLPDAGHALVALAPQMITFLQSVWQSVRCETLP
jgi:pimeloyl-ACP methyl ester carboxylesterase